MTHLRRKLLTATLTIGLAVSLLAWAGLKEGWVYSMSVDDFLTAGTLEHGQRVRLHGTAGESDFDVSHGGLWANFNIHGSQHVLRVAYQGVIPDMFHPGHDVIIEGRMDAEGTFRADTLMTKCGSRYESEPGAPGMPHADPHATAGDQASGDRGMAS